VSDDDRREAAAAAADTAIDVARRTHDDLVDVVGKLDDEGLARPSGSRDWDVAQVLGHLGSQAEIGMASLDAALGTGAAPGADDNQQVWARWNALSRQAKADGFLRLGEAWVRRHEELDNATRGSLRVGLDYLPQPVDVATLVSLRLNEMMLHAWDVKVAEDDGAALFPPAVELLIDRSGALLRYIGHADAIADRPVTVAVTTTDPSRTFGLQIGDSAQLVDRPASPQASLKLPAEAWIRLVAGRLAPEHTPAAVSMTGGAVGLDDLRRVFPGY
jgi:uncharacterized protein (TIGR03083 family)